VTDQAGNVTTYAYDSVGRLRDAQTKNSGGTVTDHWVYTFDNASNRTQVQHTTSSGTTTTSYGYNSDNALCWSLSGTSASSACSTPSGAAIYTSDPDGNRTAGPSAFSAVYDVANRLTTLDGDSLRYLSATNTELTAIGTTTLTNNVLGVGSETTGSGTTYYTRAPDGTLLAQRDSSGTQYAIADTLGSTRGLISGTTVARDYAYDPDGNATSTGSGATTAIKFAGGLDVGAGLYHFGLRYYDPATGRWTQLDPVPHVSDIAQANPFTYAAGDPVNAVDPVGADILGIGHFVKKNAEHIKNAVRVGAAVGGIYECAEGAEAGGEIGAAAGPETAAAGALGGCAAGLIGGYGFDRAAEGLLDTALDD
jgi:RHS repeat-associated protein